MKPSSFVRSSSLSLILGGLIHLVVGPIQQVFPVAPPSLEFSIRNDLIVVSHALVLVGVVGVARSGATGGSVLGKFGLGLAIVAGALFIPAEFSIQFARDLGATLDGICAMALGLGMALAGIAALWARRWHGWRRFTPLIFGLYPFLLIMPFVFIAGAPNFVAIGGWGIPAILLAIALRSERSSAEARQEAPLARVR